MKSYEIDGYKRISRARAKKLYDSGTTIVVCSSKLRPFGPWHPEITISVYEGEYSADFSWRVNRFEFFNCNYETGYYASFYAKV